MAITIFNRGKKRGSERGMENLYVKECNGLTLQLIQSGRMKARRMGWT
jgi:hypothetical protein